MLKYLKQAIFQFCQISDDIGIILSIICGCPTLTFYPYGLTPERQRRQDILLICIADYEHLIRHHSQCLYSERKYLRIGLADTDHRTFHNFPEIAGDVIMAEYGIDISIEIRDKHHRILLSESRQDILRFCNASARSAVAIISNHFSHTFGVG